MALDELDWPEARRVAHRSGLVLGTEHVEITEGDHRVLAEDVRSLTPLPPREASAMDGWAVSGRGPWRVVGGLLAGQHRTEALDNGEAVRIATGTALPEGTAGVLRQEHGALAGDRLSGDVRPGQDVRPAGEEADRNALLIAAGTRLNPAYLGLAAAAGHDGLVVFRRPRARLLILGDELLHAGPAGEGRVRDSLGPQLPAWLERLGIDVIGVHWVADTLDAHTRALESSDDADIVVTTGGTAAGPADFLKAAFAETGGELVIDTVAVRPGHPMVMGRWSDPRWLIGLPGNPQAAVVALMTLVQPLVDCLNGRPLAELEDRELRGVVSSRGDRLRLVLCASSGGSCTPTDHIGSGMLRGLSRADGFAVVPRGTGDIGDRVGWLPLPA